MGRVLGQSKQMAFAGRFFSLRNWAFLSAVLIQRWPRPAAVMEPSAWMLPLVLMVVFVGGGRSERGGGFVPYVQEATFLIITFLL